jgi:hypothetical protein
MLLDHSSQPPERYFIGVDPGQSVDPTALAVVRRTGSWRLPVFQVGHLERLPLGTPYPGIIWRVRQLLAHPEFYQRSEVVLDLTGVGRPVNDLFVGQGVDATCVTITAGHEETGEGHFYSVPKLTLVSRLQALLHDGRLQIQSELQDAPVLKAELQDFRAEVTNSGYWRFGARAGAHDDLVLAVALAVWRAASKDGMAVAQLRAFLGATDTAPVRENGVVPGAGEVIVTVRRRIWLSGTNRWLEAGRRAVSAELAASLSAEGELE